MPMGFSGSPQERFRVHHVLSSMQFFHFSVPRQPCVYWTSEDHIVAVDATCRCRKVFLLAKKEVVN
jgi:hypothetical protein